MYDYRTIDRSLVIAIASIALLIFTSNAWAQTDPINIELSQPGQPMTLEIDILSANIHVIGEQRRDVQLEVGASKSERRIVTPSGSQPISGTSYRLSATENNNVVRVDTDWRASTIDVTVRVPASAAVALSTTNNGTILVEGVTGEMQLQNVNGPITATGAGSAVIAEAINEDIRISFASLDGVTASSMTSVNGDLILGLPERPQVQVHLDTGRGEILSDFEIEVQPSQPKISRAERGGTVEIAIETLIVANINGGGPVMRLKTLNGDIQINRSE